LKNRWAPLGNLVKADDAGTPGSLSM